MTERKPLTYNERLLARRRILEHTENPCEITFYSVRLVDMTRDELLATCIWFARSLGDMVSGRHRRHKPGIIEEETSSER